MKKWAKKQGQKVNDARNGIAIQIYSGVVKNTPRDTGRACGNWHVSKGSTQPIVLDRVSDKQPLAEENSKINSTVGDETIYIQNNLPYINRLENGWSGQAPQGMVRLTMQEVQSYIDKVVRENKDK